MTGITFGSARWRWLALLALWIVLRVTALALIPESEVQHLHSYLKYGTAILGGARPYDATPNEYPPGALLLFILPALVTRSIAAYRTLFLSLLLGCDAALLYLCASPWRRGPTPSRLRPALTYLLLSSLLAPVLLCRFDLVPAALALLALRLAEAAPLLAWGTLGLSTTIKLFPAILAPLLFLADHRRRRRAMAPLLTRLAALTGGAALGILPVFAISGPPQPASTVGVLWRGLQVESLLASPFHLALLFGAKVQLVFRTGAWDVDGPLSKTIARLSLPLLVLALGYLAYYLLRRQSESPVQLVSPSGHPTRAALAGASFLGVLLLQAKVLSPQYLLWLVPWIALATAREERAALWTTAGFAVAAALTTWIYPYHYDDLVLHARPLVVLALLARNVLLVAVTVHLLLRLRRLWAAPEADHG